MSTRTHVRRVCRDAVEAQARYAELVAQIEANPAAVSEQQRQAALLAWRQAKSARAVVAELSPQDILEAIESSARLALVPRVNAPAPLPPAPPAEPGERMTYEQLLDAVHRVRAGESYRSVAAGLGRGRDTVKQAVRQWNQGVSRLAKRAQAEGLWPEGRAS